jgi:hypothetical protein
MSEYLVLIYEDENAFAEAGEEVGGRLLAAHTEFNTKNAAAIKGGNALQSVATGTTIRGDGAGSVTVTDGPFVETKEALAGYYLIEAADLDEAIAIAKKVPAPFGGVEVRPIMVFS